MNTNQLKQVEALVSLEGAYSGFESAIARVRSVNPNVRVVRVSSSQVQAASHALMPGAPGTAQLVSSLATAAENGTVADIPPALTSASLSDGVQSAFTPSGQYLATTYPAQQTQGLSSYPYPALSSLQAIPAAYTSAPATQSGSAPVTSAASYLPTSLPLASPVMTQIGQLTFSNMPSASTLLNQSTNPASDATPTPQNAPILHMAPIMTDVQNSPTPETFPVASNDSQPSTTATDSAGLIEQILSAVASIIDTLRNLTH